MKDLLELNLKSSKAPLNWKIWSTQIPLFAPETLFMTRFDVIAELQYQ